MTKLLKRLWREEEGQDLTEYGLLLVLISLVAVVAIGSLGNEVNHMYSHAARRILHKGADYQ